ALAAAARPVPDAPRRLPGRPAAPRRERAGAPRVVPRSHDPRRDPPGEDVARVGAPRPRQARLLRPAPAARRERDASGPLGSRTIRLTTSARPRYASAVV